MDSNDLCPLYFIRGVTYINHYLHLNRRQPGNKLRR